MKWSLILLSICVLFSCAPEKIEADLLVKNANIYTVNENFETATAFVVRDGKFLEIGLKPELELKYRIKEVFDAQGKTIVPGLIDAHAHLYNLGVGMQHVNLVGTNSLAEVLDKVVAFQKEKPASFIYGRGWDQNDWDVKQFPTKHELDSLFPDIPVALTRIDGHALWVNSKALELSGINRFTKVVGGEVVLQDGEPSGILVDAPMSLVYDIMPSMSREAQIRGLKEAEAKCLSLGLTTINDAGLSKEVIALIDSLQQAGEMQLRVYAMVSSNPSDLDHFLTNGIVKTDRLNVRSVKVYADGALGSRGAALRAPYSDQPGHYGAMITRQEALEKLALRIRDAGYQMNTHAIGDSANISVLRAYKNALNDVPDPRWKVEHAQIVTPGDIDHFSKKIIPSIQPTHATSDMYWAEERVGSERMKGAYAYKALLEASGVIVLGTDFPIEEVNPMHTFYTAVARKDLQQYPEGGFQKDQALTREETLKGMTSWAAYSNFEENEKGSISSGKFADFTVLEKDIMTIPEDSIPGVRVHATFINGEKVFSRE